MNFLTLTITKILSSYGYNVFFSSSSLEKLGSSLYKSDIDAALDTVSIMIVVLTKAEYATSQLVKYEWDSFYNDYLSGVRKEANLFTLTNNINVNDLPRTLRNVQNFDYKEHFDSLCSFINDALSKQENKTNDVPIENKETNKNYYW